MVHQKMETVASDNNQIESLIKKALVQAKIERRLVIGLPQIVKCLMEDRFDVPIFCLMAPPKSGDFATHMNEVLLKAYCLENDIYIIQLDSAEKMCRIVEHPVTESCILIHLNPAGDSDCEGTFLDEDFQMTKIERKIVNYCEDHWNDLDKEVVRLPEK